MSFQNGKFISTAEAAEIIGCTARHVRHLVLKKGYVKGERFGPTAIIVERKSAEKYAKTSHSRGRPRSNEPKLN